MNRRKQSQKARRAGQSSAKSTDRALAQSAQVVGRAFVEVPGQDFTRQAPSWLLVQHPPKQIRNQMIWVQGKTQTQQTISNSAPTEKNFSFQFSDLASLVGLASFFDQYCIYSVTANVTPDFEGAGSTLYTFGTCATAIDYDNVTNIGSLANIEAYASAVIFEMSSGQSLTRYLKPCVAPALYTSGASFSGYGVQRLWIDSSVTTVPHYGFRSFFVSNTVSGLTVTYDFNYIVGLRNNI
jgi:hypothetical protein